MMCAPYGAQIPKMEHQFYQPTKCSLTLPAIPSQMQPEPQGGSFMPTPSRLTIITEKTPKFFFGFSETL